MTEYIPLAQKGAADGVAELDSTTRLPEVQLPVGIVGHVSVADSNHEAEPEDHVIVYTSLTSARTVTLPSTGFVVGRSLMIIDGTGAAAEHPIIVAGAINGGIALVLGEAHGRVHLTFTGTEWVTPDGYAITAAAPAVAGTKYYVSPEGSDSNSGASEATPFRTVAHAITVATAPGSAILLQGGQTFATIFPEGLKGTAEKPIVFSSYGSGQAIVGEEVWFHSAEYLTFDNLRFDTKGIFQAGSEEHQEAKHIAIQRCTMSQGADAASKEGSVISMFGESMAVRGCYLSEIGWCALYLVGTGCVVDRNLILHCGLNTAISAKPHAMYLKTSDVVVRGNVCSYNTSSLISPRRRNTTIIGNYLTNGTEAVAYFAEDEVAGTSVIEANHMAAISEGGIYVPEESGRLLESFVIANNEITVTNGAMLELHESRGTYTMYGNTPSYAWASTGALLQRNPVGGEFPNSIRGLSNAMVAGKVLVDSTTVSSVSRIMLTRQAGGTNPGAVYVAKITEWHSFEIASTDSSDTGTVAYEVFEAA